MKYNNIFYLGYFTAIFSILALAADVNYNFNIVNANVAPDGFSRTGVLVNGAFPGTLIQAQKTDTLHITVNNQLTNPAMRQELLKICFYCFVINYRTLPDEARQSIGMVW